SSDDGVVAKVLGQFLRLLRAERADTDLAALCPETEVAVDRADVDRRRDADVRRVGVERLVELLFDPDGRLHLGRLACCPHGSGPGLNSFLECAPAYEARLLAAGASSSPSGVVLRRASRGCHRHWPRRARNSRTATFSGVPGRALVGSGIRARPLKSWTPRRANLLVDG